MKRGKAAGVDGITVDLLKEGEDIVLEKLAVVLFSKCLKNLKVPKLEKKCQHNSDSQEKGHQRSSELQA